MRQPQLTFLFCELMKQTRLSDAHVADDDVFEDVGVVVRSGSHFGTWKGERDKSFSQIESISTKMNRAQISASVFDLRPTNFSRVADLTMRFH